MIISPHDSLDIDISEIIAEEARDNRTLDFIGIALGAFAGIILICLLA